MTGPAADHELGKGTHVGDDAAHGVEDEQDVLLSTALGFRLHHYVARLDGGHTSND